MDRCQSRPGIRLLLHKTTVSQQTSYIYHSVTGDITLTPLSDGRVEIRHICTEADASVLVIQSDGLTLEMLRELHRADNREVESNLREKRVPMTAVERERIEAWRCDPTHPERRKEKLFPDGYQRWNLSLDSLSDDQDGTDPDRDAVMYRAWINSQPEEDEERDRVRDYVSTLPLRQRQIYQLHIIEERTLKAAADMMGVTHQRASAILKQLKRNLFSQFRQDATPAPSRKVQQPVYNKV